MNLKELDIAFVDSLGKERLGEAVMDLGEVAWDSVLGSGALEQVPVLGVLAKITNACSSVRDQYFARKILLFLGKVGELSDEERSKLLDDLKINKGSDEKVGESVLLLLERLDDMTKPEMLGKVFQSCARGEVTSEQAFRLSSLVERTYIGDLVLLDQLGKGFSPAEQSYLKNAGFLVPKLNENELSTMETYFDSGGNNPSKEYKLEYEFIWDAFLLAWVLFENKYSMRHVIPMSKIKAMGYEW